MIEIGVVMKDRQIQLLRRCSDQKVWNLSAAPAALREHPLHLECAPHMPGRRLDNVEHGERSEQLVPLFHIARGIDDFEIADPRATELARLGQRRNDVSDGSFVETLQDAGVDQERSAPRFSPIVQAGLA